MKMLKKEMFFRPLGSKVVTLSFGYFDQKHYLGPIVTTPLLQYDTL